jgi:hypothetical protein
LEKFSENFGIFQALCVYNGRGRTRESLPGRAQQKKERVMKTLVKNFLSEAGYSDEQIREGFEYADSIGYSDKDRLGQLALSRILYNDNQLEAGEVVGWEPVDWAEWEHESDSLLTVNERRTSDEST